MRPETIAIHAGNKADADSGAVIQPITLSTTFVRAADGGYPSGYTYTRASNPNRDSLEQVLTRLEQGADAAAFSSGNAAAAAVFQSLGPGSHLLAPEDMYHGLRNLLNDVFTGVLSVSYCNMSDLKAVEAAVRADTRLIWIETPSNPLLKITDVRAIATIAGRHGIRLVCDNTFATPVFQQPLALGADLAMHSSTKYLGGHSDVLGGALIAAKKDDWWKKIRTIQEISGAVPAPFDCYMLVRSIKTLPYRMKGHAHNAVQVAAFLQAHPNVEQVFYPGLADHPSYAVAAGQMSSPGAMLSFLVRGGEDRARAVVNKLALFTQATSLGGVESLAEHRASVEGPESKTPLNLLRISVGLEHVDDLLDDLRQALDTP